MRRLELRGSQPARTVLSTFGLISAGQGIRAGDPRPARRSWRAHPEVLYLVAGQTHPEVVKHEGESYRLGLERLVRDLDLTEHVHFLDRFLTDDELAVLLRSTDLYLTPYRSREQIVSGALTFAVAAGCPVVSTPYFYAEDLLGSGAGVLVPFDDAAGLGRGGAGPARPPRKLAAARAEARRVGAALAWPSVGKATLGCSPRRPTARPPGTGREARLSLCRHVDPARPPATLVDDVGIVQHAEGRRQPLHRLLRRRRGPAGDRRARTGSGRSAIRVRADSVRSSRLPVHALGLRDSARHAQLPRPTTGAGWTSRTTATTWAGRSGLSARSSAPSGRTGAAACAC